MSPIMNKILEYLRPEPHAFRFGKDTWDPTYRFETSWLFTPWVFFGIRATLTLYLWFTTFFIIGWEVSGTHPGYSYHDANKSFSLYTQLTYWGLCFYFLVASVHSFSYALHGHPPLLNRFPRPLQALHYLFYSTITTFPFLVTIVFWAVLYPGNLVWHRYEWWSNVSQHAMNSGFALFEIVFSRVDPPPFVHVLYLEIILALYCGLAYVTYATKGYFVYSFLDPSASRTTTNAAGQKINSGGVGKGGVPVYIVLIGLGCLGAFSLSRGAMALRKHITETKRGTMGKFVRGEDVMQPERLETGVSSKETSVVGTEREVSERR